MNPRPPRCESDDNLNHNKQLSRKPNNSNPHHVLLVPVSPHKSFSRRTKCGQGSIQLQDVNFPLTPPSEPRDLLILSTTYLSTRVFSILLHPTRTRSIPLVFKKWGQNGDTCPIHFKSFVGPLSCIFPSDGHQISTLLCSKLHTKMSLLDLRRHCSPFVRHVPDDNDGRSCAIKGQPTLLQCKRAINILDQLFPDLPSSFGYGSLNLIPCGC